MRRALDEQPLPLITADRDVRPYWSDVPMCIDLCSGTLEVLRVPRMLGRIDGVEYGETCLTIEPWS